MVEVILLGFDFFISMYFYMLYWLFKESLPVTLSKSGKVIKIIFVVVVRTRYMYLEPFHKWNDVRQRW